MIFINLMISAHAEIGSGGYDALIGPYSYVNAIAAATKDFNVPFFTTPVASSLMQVSHLLSL